MAELAETKNYELKNNAEVDARIDAYIKEKPEAWQKIQALIQENPDRAARQIVNNRITIADMKQERKQGYSNWKASVREVIDKTLGEKKHQVIAKNLDQKYPTRKEDQKVADRYYREGETTLCNVGEDITLKTKAHRGQKDVEAAKKQGQKI